MVILAAPNLSNSVVRKAHHVALSGNAHRAGGNQDGPDGGFIDVHVAARIARRVECPVLGLIRHITSLGVVSKVRQSAVPFDPVFMTDEHSATVITNGRFAFVSEHHETMNEMASVSGWTSQLDQCVTLRVPIGRHEMRLSPHHRQDAAKVADQISGMAGDREEGFITVVKTGNVFQEVGLVISRDRFQIHDNTNKITYWCYLASTVWGYGGR